MTTYDKLIATCESAGIKPMSDITAAKILAVVYHFDNESFTHCPKLLSDVAYIQRAYHLKGGETPDKAFVVVLCQYIRSIEKNGCVMPPWAAKLFGERYNITV